MSQSELEAQLLNQLHIVSVGSVAPIWTSNGACLRVRIDSIEPPPSAKTPCARLVDSSEVIVAPRTRSRAPEEGDDEAERVWRTQPLRVQPSRPECEHARCGGGPSAPRDCAIEVGAACATSAKRATALF